MPTESSWTDSYTPRRPSVLLSFLVSSTLPMSTFFNLPFFFIFLLSCSSTHPFYIKDNAGQSNQSSGPSIAKVRVKNCQEHYHSCSWRREGIFMDVHTGAHQFKTSAHLGRNATFKRLASYVSTLSMWEAFLAGIWRAPFTNQAISQVGICPTESHTPFSYSEWI